MGAEERLVSLVGSETGTQPGAEGGLEAVHGGLGQRATTVMNGAFPVGLAEEANLFDRHSCPQTLVDWAADPAPPAIADLRKP